MSSRFIATCESVYHFTWPTLACTSTSRTYESSCSWSSRKKSEIQREMKSSMAEFAFTTSQHKLGRLKDANGQQSERKKCCLSNGFSLFASLLCYVYREHSTEGLSIVLLEPLIAILSIRSYNFRDSRINSSRRLACQIRLAEFALAPKRP